MINQKIGASHIRKEVAERRTGRWRFGMRGWLAPWSRRLFEVFTYHRIIFGEKTRPSENFCISSIWRMSG